MNSLFGSLSNIFFRHYDVRIAEGITMTGQLITRSVTKELNNYFNKELKTEDIDYAYYSDTDSCYITLNSFVKEKFTNDDKLTIVDKLDKYSASKIEPFISKVCNSLISYLNAHENLIKFKREIIADRGVWLAKKRYAVNVYNSEGVSYNPPKLKIMGMEIVRSSTPEPVRKALKEAVSIALTKNESTLRQYVGDIECNWNELSPEAIAFPRGINGLADYRDTNSIFRKSTPMHVRGALIYNHLITSKNLEKQYQLIREGDKIKFVYLREPNPLGSHVISFIGEIPPEFKLDNYIDYDKMFEKSFLEPLNSLLSCIGWRIKEQASLEGLFG